MKYLVALAFLFFISGPASGQQAPLMIPPLCPGLATTTIPGSWKAIALNSVVPVGLNPPVGAVAARLFVTSGTMIWTSDGSAPAVGGAFFHGFSTNGGQDLSLCGVVISSFLAIGVGTPSTAFILVEFYKP